VVFIEAREENVGKCRQLEKHGGGDLSCSHGKLDYKCLLI
jgi:hypothetical protein